MAVKIHPDGPVTTVTAQNEAGFELAELQAIVGGYIERVPTTPVASTLTTEYQLEDGEAYVDEEGILKAKKINPLACQLLGYAPLVGDVLIMTQEEKALFARR